MWSDHETDIDLLGFEHLVSSVTDIVKRKDLLPATIGVYGDWGSGKSSLLKMVSEDLSKDTNICVISFNGWLFEGYDDAKTALMETIIDEITSKRTLSDKAKGMALKLLRRVDWFRLAGSTIKSLIKYGFAYTVAGPVGLAAFGISDSKEILDKAKAVTDSLKESEINDMLNNESQQSLRRGVREFRQDFSNLLKETKIKCLVVVIDDLDRCLPDTIIETLEAIKLFLFVDNTAFILGADERLIKSAVRRRFPDIPGDKAEVGRDYLEKLIQYPIRIPSLSYSELLTYISLLITNSSNMPPDKAEILRQKVLRSSTDLERIFKLEFLKEQLGTIPDELLERLSIAERIAPILSRGTSGNPRQCKRFLNTLIMRLNMAETRGIKLSQRILAKLMLLEYFHPDYFRQLALWQAKQEGKPIEIKKLELSSIIKAKKTEKGEKAEGKENATAKISSIEPELDVWQKEPQLAEWLHLEPFLKDEDLRPYFYFSRDKLGAMISSSQRMGIQAAEILQGIISPSAGKRRNAFSQLNALSPGDSSAIFEALTDKARNEEDFGAETSAFQRVLEFAEAKKDFCLNLVHFLENLPEISVPLSTPPRLKNICKGTDAESAAVKIANKWKTSTANTKLAVAAKEAFK